MALKVQQASEKVQQAIPVDREMLAKLTLNTEEMIAERQKFQEEQKHKAESKNMLAGWFFTKIFTSSFRYCFKNKQKNCVYCLISL